MQSLSAIIFIKKESERIPNKNFRLFNGRPLFTIILELLDSYPLIDKILVDSDSKEIQDYTSSLSKGIPIVRPEHLLGGHITANALLEHDIRFSDSAHFFQTHVTNPLLSVSTITKAIEKYFSSLTDHDSLFSVSRIQHRVFDKNANPINHEKTKLLRTQDLDPVFHENSNFFIFSKNSFKNAGNNRVGLKPLMYEISPIEAVDIDYENEFRLAELIDKNKNLFPDIFN